MLALGDAVADALALIGADEAAVERWLGRPCACHERRAKLNMLGSWARRVLSGKLERAQEFLDQLMFD
jgi:hypothetical protein